MPPARARTLLSAALAFAPGGCAARPARPFTFENGPEARIPFHAAGGREVLFPLRIKAASHLSRALLFTLDSGASVSYLDSGVARELGLTVSSGGTVQGSGRERIPVGKIPGVAFELSGLESSGHTVNATSLRPVQPDGEAMDGFLGSDFIERFVITLDFVNGVMTLSDPSRFEYRGKGTVLPVTFRGGKPPVRHIQMGNGLGEGSEQGVVGHADSFALGGLLLPGALTACCAPVEWQRSMFGTEILRRFTVTFDYTRSRIILEPNEHFGDPFPAN